MNFTKDELRELDISLSVLKWHFLDNIEFEKQNCLDISYSKTMYNRCLKFIRKIDANTKETE